MLQPGSETIGGFRLKQRLGKGGFAEVWEAAAPDGSLVALKFIDTRNRDASLLRGEIRVLRSIAELRHPNLIRLFDVFASSRYLVLSMERADGTLDELRQAYVAETGCNVPPDHALELLEQAAQGLDFLAGLKLTGYNMASAGMQHCDVKPSNLLLLGETVKVADFGLCAGLGQQTHRSGCRGTPPFAAPEVYHGRPSDRTDQYSLAVTWCALVGGSRMFLPGALSGAIRGIPIDLTKAREREVPVLARALHPDPTCRWSSCREFVAALRDAIKGARRKSGRYRRPLLIAPRTGGGSNAK